LKNRKLKKNFCQGGFDPQILPIPPFSSFPMPYFVSKITLNTSQISILLAIIKLFFPVIVILFFTKMKMFVPIEKVSTLHGQELKLSQAPCVNGNKHILNFGYAPQNEFYKKLMRTSFLHTRMKNS